MPNKVAQLSSNTSACYKSKKASIDRYARSIIYAQEEKVSPLGAVNQNTLEVEASRYIKFRMHYTMSLYKMAKNTTMSGTM